MVADNLTPQEVSQLDLKIVQGVIILDGGPTAHSSILLRALGLPAMVLRVPPSPGPISRARCRSASTARAARSGSIPAPA